MVTLEKTNIKIKKCALALMKSHGWKDALKEWKVWFKETENSYTYTLHDRAICKFPLSDLVSAIKDLDAAAELQSEYGYKFSSRAWMKQANGDTHGASTDNAKKKSVKKTENHNAKTIFSKIKSVFVSDESRKDWLKFILKGVTLKD